MRLVVDILFFFQAEDGIRDLVRSRGLGDVYKRQAEAVERLWPSARRHDLVTGALQVHAIQFDDVWFVINDEDFRIHSSLPASLADVSERWRVCKRSVTRQDVRR